MQKRVIKRFLLEVKDWIVSYLIVLLVPIIICSIFFLYTYLIIWEETKDSNTVALQIVASELDGEFRSFITIENNVQLNDRIKSAEQIRLPLNGDKRYLLLKASEAFDDCIVTSGKFIKSYQLSLPMSEMTLIPAGGYTHLQGSYVCMGESCGYSQEEWKELLRQRREREILVTPNGKEILYITSLPGYGSVVKKNMILSLNTDYLQQILAKLDNMENGGILLLSGAGDVLASRNMDEVDTDLLTEEIHVGDGYQRMSIRGGDVMVSCIELENAGVKLISVIPYKEFWETSLKSLSTFLVVFALCIFIGVAVSYAFSLGKQRTWGRLSSIMKSKHDINGSNMFSRNKVISEAVNDIVKEYHDMQSKLVSMDSMKKDLLMISILRGRIRAEEAEQVLSKYGVKAEFGNYVVILFCVNGFDRFYDEYERVDEEELQVVRNQVTTIVQDFNQRGFSCEIMNLDAQIVCVVDFGDLERDKCYEQIAGIYGDNDSLTISISDVHEHVISLQNAYSEVLRVREYQLNTGDYSPMNYLEMIQKTKIGYLYSMEDEKTLNHWICEGKVSEALRLLEEIYEKNIRNISGSEVLTRCLIWSMTASVLRAETELKQRAELPDMCDFLEKIERTNSISEAKGLLAKRIEEICGNVSKGKTGDRVTKQVKEYIHQCYADPNLSNREIADHCHISISYLSTYFKEREGMNLLSYIHMVRLNKAKDLLGNTDLVLEEIWENVGYNSKATFIRLFKKYEGITPTEYRKKKQLKD